jgi:hypothetical protein
MSLSAAGTTEKIKMTIKQEGNEHTDCLNGIVWLIQPAFRFQSR